MLQKGKLKYRETEPIFFPERKEIAAGLLKNKNATLPVHVSTH